MTTTLRYIEKGMKVFDRDRNEIGTVEFVQFGDDDPETPELEATGLSDLGDRDRSLMDVIASAFIPQDDLPEEIRERLLHQGFVRVDSAQLFAADRYVTPDQIASVSSDGLVLKVNHDELVSRR